MRAVLIRWRLLVSALQPKTATTTTTNYYLVTTDKSIDDVFYVKSRILKVKNLLETGSQRCRGVNLFFPPTFVTATSKTRKPLPAVSVPTAIAGD